MTNQKDQKKNATNEEISEISPEVSQRVCSHMNDDHALSIYAMAKSTLKKYSSEKQKSLSNAEMKSISLSGYELSFILCSGDVCEKRNITVPFHPPLKSPSEAKARIVQEHEKSFTPQFSWIFSEPIPLCVYFVMLLFANLVFLMEDKDIVAIVPTLPNTLQGIIDSSFCCHFTFASRLRTLAYITFAAHIVESLVVAYVCQTRLKLPKMTTLKWALLVSIVGIYPLGMRVIEFAIMKSKLEKKKNI